MASWKKVIVSGSSAALSALQVDNLLSGVVTGSANGTLGIQAINGTGNIVATTGASELVASGSFSGSFRGDGTNLTGVTATPSFPTTVKTNIVSTDKFFINDDPGDGTAGNKKITYGDLLVDLAGTNLVTESNDSLALATTITGITSITSTSFTGSLSGSLVGTASWASNATSASYVLNAVSSSYALSASNAQTASYVLNAISSSYALSASNAQTASYILNAVSSSYALSASNAQTASFISTASWANNAVNAMTASWATNVNTASWANNATSASYALTASYAANGGTLLNALTFGTGLSGSASTFNGSAAVNVAISGSVSLTSGYHTKWTGTGLANSFISENAAQVTIATGSTISAGGLTVTGNSTFNNNLTVTGDLSVNGTTTFVNTTNTYIKDQFIGLASGSNTLVDAGFVAQYSTGSGAGPTGSAFFLSSTSTGTFGRWAVASGINAASGSGALTVDEYVVTTKISSNTAPSAAPTWGGATNGSGNMWIKSDTGDIYIYA